MQKGQICLDIWMDGWMSVCLSIYLSILYLHQEKKQEGTNRQWTGTSVSCVKCTNLIVLFMSIYLIISIFILDLEKQCKNSPDLTWHNREQHSTVEKKSLLGKKVTQWLRMLLPVPILQYHILAYPVLALLDMMNRSQNFQQKTC